MSRTTLVLAVLGATLALAPAAGADTEIERETVAVGGATVNATLMQRTDGAVYVNVVVHDTRADGICAHGTIRWRHVNGNAYDDYGMHVCGTGTGESFSVPARDWRAYTGVDAGAFVDGGAAGYDPVRRWDKRTLRAQADQIMRRSYGSFRFYKRAVHPWPFDWKDNGCSGPTPGNWKRLFYWACAQHDFGYRNYGQYLNLGRNESTREWIDGRFKRELLNVCRREILRNNCIAAANIMWSAVRAKGGPYFYG